ncbi:hypothetical protein [Natranaeroarchaeum sulfidigenes]|uniref:Glutamate-cysteine ligase, GCS2 n=1 Tax=Natranaeroarchaeum sulfidigenes TaxID=2784880 RepID=A0A897MZU8_9EURY|nr:hypothetical protein [Natranaeroarchaeum sulfidigenes]QSG03636.1 Glutamate-cysteine ligase, GCS2 [Natranaeroarchaeum sulfidigenes]
MADTTDTGTELVRRSLSDETEVIFDERVEEQAETVAELLADAELDNPSFALGIEIETYAVDDTSLTRLPDSVFEAPCDRELGLHNAELHTEPTRFDEDGIAGQVAQLRENLDASRAAADDADTEIVLDAMWAVPPAEGSQSYLGDVEDDEGVTVARNMTASPRYWALDNEILAQGNGSVSLSVPGAEVSFPSILCESLTSSIQPHLQIPDADALPAYYNAAIRTLGPVLALSTNSPLLPVDLYDVDDPEQLLEETHHELRIAAFEQSINAAWNKVRVPEDIETTHDTISYLLDDPTCAPFLREWVADSERETIDGRLWEFDHKRGTYWRWVRSVVGGQPVGEGDSRSVRIEYRPLPTQPTIRGNVGLQVLVAGLLRGIVATDHPLTELDHVDAERSFYAAAENGLDADLAWVLADGEYTEANDEIYGELFDLVRTGLDEQGVSGETTAHYIDPLEARWKAGTTPSSWKLDRIRTELAAGHSFENAVERMQQAYREHSRSGTPFSDWQ